MNVDQDKILLKQCTSHKRYFCFFSIINAGSSFYKQFALLKVMLYLVFGKQQYYQFCSEDLSLQFMILFHNIMYNNFSETVRIDVLNQTVRRARAQKLPIPHENVTVNLMQDLSRKYIGETHHLKIVFFLIGMVGKPFLIFGCLSFAFNKGKENYFTKLIFYFCQNWMFSS